MISVFAEQDIFYDRYIMSCAKIENIYKKPTVSTMGMFSIFDNKEIQEIYQDEPILETYPNMPILETYSDETILNEKNSIFNMSDQDFFRETWIKKLEDIKSSSEAYLIDDFIEMPNELAINYAYQLIMQLSELNIFPDKLSASADEGICMKFQNKSRNLFFEVYNNGELGYIIEDVYNSRIVENEDVYSIKEISYKINDFIMI